MKLSDLLQSYCSLNIAKDLEISGISTMSKSVQHDFAFIAMQGNKVHGERYIEEAVNNGAVVIIADKPIETAVGVDVLVCKSLKQNFNHIVDRFYADELNFPINTLAITGTNGKTSTAMLISESLTKLDTKTAVVGTLGDGIYGKELSSTKMTTPDRLTVLNEIRAFKIQNAQSLVIEASSHGLEQKRLNNIPIKTAVFTNLTHDHLDYHGNLENYKEAKLKLFKDFSLENAIINIDDANAQDFLITAKKNNDLNYALTYSLKNSDADIYVKKAKYSKSGSEINCTVLNNEFNFTTTLIGDFNVLNLMAVIGVLYANNYPLDKIRKVLATLSPINGRMNSVTAGDNDKPLVVVDYAHTPDALEKAIRTLNVFKGSKSKMIVVFGCGGDRDKEKRPVMGNIAERIADIVIVTSDNPRTECAKSIIKDIVSGMKKQPVVIEDRAEAIKHAISVSNTDDIVLIAGKGHEQGQYIKNKVIEFCDKEEVSKAFNEIRVI